MLTGAIEDTESHEEAIYTESDKTLLKRMVGPAEQMNNSGEEVTVDAQDAEPSPGKLVDNSSVEQVNQSSNAVVDHRRKSTLVRGARFNGKLAAGQSRELQDWDSLDLEDNAGRPARVTDHRQETDYDGKNLLKHHRSSYKLLGCDELSNCGFQYPPQRPESISALKQIQ